MWGSSIASRFLDVVNYSGVPQEWQSYMSANYYSNVNNYKVGWYVDGWKGTANLPSSGFAPYSIIFSTAYYQNGGYDVLGIPQSFVHADYLVDFTYGHPYIQDFQKYVPGVGLKTYTMVLNPYVKNVQYGMWGVVFPINGQLRDYWYFKFYELGYPMCNEYLWSNSSGTYTVQWFMRLNGSKTYVAYKAGVFYRSSDIYIPQDDSLFAQHVIKNVGCDGECGTGGGTIISQDYSITGSQICKGVESSSPWNCIEPGSVFYNSDNYIYHQLQLENVYEPLQVKHEWYNPLGLLVADDVYYTDDPVASGYPYWSSYKVWNPLYIASTTNYGQWRVDTYIDSVKVQSNYFNVLAPPLPEPPYYFAGTTVSESWTHGSTDPNAPNYWDLQPVNPRTEFAVGNSVTVLSKAIDVNSNHRWKTEFFINGNLVWTDESGWLYVGSSGWDYSSATPTLANVQAGNGQAKVWLDIGSGYELLEQKSFTVGDSTVPFVYAGSQVCEGWVNGSTDPNAPNYWDLQAVNPGTNYQIGDRVYVLAQAENVSVDHEWKVQVYYNGAYQWEHLSGWQDLNGGVWTYSNFAPYVDNVQAGNYELRLFLRTNGDFALQDSKMFTVEPPPSSSIPYFVNFENSDFGYFLEDNTGLNNGSIALANVDGHNCLELQNIGQADASWKLQAKKVGFDFVVNTAYAGSIWIKGQTTGTIYVAVEKNTDPWNNLGLWKALNITTEWAEYDLGFTFSGGATSAETRFTIQFGNYPGKFWVDNVVFQ